MTVVIISSHYIGEDYTEDRTEYSNVTNCAFQYQPYNGNSYWIYMEFKEGSKEYELYNDGTLYVEIEPKKDEIFIWND